MEGQVISKYEDASISELLFKYLRHWRWFVVSIIICCGIAFLYIKATPNIYKRTASVLIKSEDNTKDITAAFSDVNPFGSGANVNNEIEAFKSPQILQEVVKRLNLDVSYKMNSGLRKIELYNQSPVKVTFTDTQDQEFFSFCLELKPDSLAILSGFEQNGIKFEQNIKAKLNDIVTTPVGSVEISPTLFYSSEMYNISIKITKSSSKVATRQLAGRLTVSLLSKENTIIVLDFMDESTQRAEDVLATIITVYNENWVNEKNKVAFNTSRFINDRLPLIEKELGGIDDNLEQYKSQNMLTDLQSAASLYMQESSEYSGKILEVRNHLSTVRYLKKYLDNSSRVADLLPTNTGLNNSAIESQIGQYNSLLLKRNGLMANSSEKNPLIVEMNNSLNAMRKSIVRTVDNLIAALNMQLLNLQAQEDRMNKKIESNPGQEKHLISIEREQKIKESLYIYLLQKREENALSLAMTTTNTQIITPPSGTNAPIAPKKYMILIVAFVLGIVLPAAVIWGRDTLYPTVRGRRDLNNLSVPLLGTIPQAPATNKNMSVPLVQERNQDVINESFRIIRTNIDFTNSSDTRVVMITSVEPGPGKTFVTENLAMCFALTGKKIVVLDLDLRKATLSKIISSPKSGISNYLSGMITDERMIIIKDYFHSGFDIIPVGDIPPNPVELLLNDKLKVLLDKLKVEYDYVFIDSTQVDLVTDATIISKFSDLSIFVVREGFSDRRVLSELESIYSSGKFNNMTLLLNGTIPDLPRTNIILHPFVPPISVS